MASMAPEPSVSKRSNASLCLFLYFFFEVRKRKRAKASEFFRRRFRSFVSGGGEHRRRQSKELIQRKNSAFLCLASRGKTKKKQATPTESPASAPRTGRASLPFLQQHQQHRGHAWSSRVAPTRRRGGRRFAVVVVFVSRWLSLFFSFRKHEFSDVSSVASEEQREEQRDVRQDGFILGHRQLTTTTTRNKMHARNSSQ